MLDEVLWIGIDGRCPDGAGHALPSEVRARAGALALSALRGDPVSEVVDAGGGTFELRAAAASPDRAIVWVTDVSAQVARVADLERTATRHHQMLAIMSSGLWVIDADSRTVYASPRMAEILGTTPERMLGRSMFDFMDDEGRAIAERNVERRRSGVSETHPFIFRDTAGRGVWTEIESGPLLGPGGEYLGAVGVVHDVTEAVLQRDEVARLSSILDRSLNEIYVFEADSLAFRYANQGALQNLGYTLEQLMQLKPWDLKPEYDEASFREMVAPLRAGQRRHLFDTHHVRADGSTYPVHVHLECVMHGDDAVFVAIMEDVTERVAAATALRESQERFRSIIENSSEMVFVLGPDLKLSFVSPSASRWLGWEADQLIGRNPLDLVHPDDLERASTSLGGLVAGEEVRALVLRLAHANGTWRVTDTVARNLTHVPGIGGILANTRDITDVQRLEAQVQQAQKLESIGRLAGGIAHDFNNVLTAVLSYAELLMMEGRGNADDIQEILRAGERARDLTQQLLAFARRQIVTPRATDLNELVRRAVRMLERLLGEDIVVSVALSAAAWPVLVDPSQIEQVLLNLAVNARDAMPDGGRLTLETENVWVDDEAVARHPEMKVGPHVALVVSDTGSGIPSDALPHIFEPFFTTKDQGKGTGLGLATVYGIVRQCGGFVWVYSEVGVGTTFKVYFPRSEVSPSVESARPSRALPRPTESVILVEDDAAVRELAVRALSGAGYRVRAFPLPADALSLSDAELRACHLLLTDVVMPGMSGKVLAEALTARHPGLRVLYVSGYTQNTIVHHGVLEEGIEFLAKPFTPNVLLVRVRELLSDP